MQPSASTTFAIRQTNRHDLIGQPALLAGGGSLRCDCSASRLLVRTAHVPALRHVLGRLAHGDIGIGVRLQFGVGREVEAALRHHRHRFHADAQEGVAHAGLDLRGGDVDRLHRRAAEAVDRHAADCLRQAGQQADDARQVVALRGLGVGAAKDHVLQQRRVQVGALRAGLAPPARPACRAAPRPAALAGEVKGRTGIGGNDGFHGVFSFERIGPRLRVVDRVSMREW